ncbi:MAG: membrane protein insertion efficiency factor YidD [Nitrosomonas sp.]|uniref:membrane protein insertion efficiency factor YidD n=1 Tax=Nitrosomonas sp. TaxID=42353 RepID=UPI002733592C|nr:membrane protein insertion efficiency factor YidD [Nitrosomonas sp.]MDP3281253.1 membrane protein insertion efficiency factor YidD [Nitrosomonas sp.]MDP3664667.1 membrane protein insertion efficiency factor YidD [Nitrosomonas sp.]MDZ4106147.1 membrane protein insertion efficiency factor YidD [Nitrosomonas sp.]
MSRLIIAFIKFYQHCISPLSAPSCRFSPTCSQYACEAYEKYGLFHGTRLSIWRILRCNPWSKGGYEPVP